MSSLAELIDQLEPDAWRSGVGFSPEVDACTQRLLRTESEVKKVILLRDWIAKYQPCVFGKLAVGAPDLVEFCIVGPEDIKEGDDFVRAKIQEARGRWKRLAESGAKSAFVLVACCDRLVTAAPTEGLRAAALRLFELYLPEEAPIRADWPYLDSIVLSDIGRRSLRRFTASSDVFAVQGDRRWWHDHRFPGGIAFSFNSPGHMAAACRQRMTLLQAEEAALQEEDLPKQLRRAQKTRRDFAQLQLHTVSSVDHVLRLAMNTIANASAGDPHTGANWEPAVSLLTRHADAICPVSGIDGDPKLVRHDFSSYLGWYHTDYTVPSVFFVSPDEKRPTAARPYALDFSYIYDKRASDHRERMKGITRRSRRGKP